MSEYKDSVFNQDKAKEGADSWKAPDTTAFKNIKPGDLPESTYDYRGADTGNGKPAAQGGDIYNADGLPSSTYSYKGDNSAGNGKPTSDVGRTWDGVKDGTPDDEYNYKGDSAAGKGKNTQNNNKKG